MRHCFDGIDVFTIVWCLRPAVRRISSLGKFIEAKSHHSDGVFFLYIGNQDDNTDLLVSVDGIENFCYAFSTMMTIEMSWSVLMVLRIFPMFFIMLICWSVLMVLRIFPIFFTMLMMEICLPVLMILRIFPIHSRPG